MSIVKKNPTLTLIEKSEEVSLKSLAGRGEAGAREEEEGEDGRWLEGGEGGREEEKEERERREPQRDPKQTN